MKQKNNLRMVFSIVFAVLAYLSGMDHLFYFCIFAYAAIWLIPLGRKRSVIAGKALLSILLFVLAAKVQINRTDKETSILTVSYLDVGQGDSTLIELPDGETVLIDGGTYEYGSTVVNELKLRGINTVDYMIATHPHADHIGGLPAVIDVVNVKAFYEPDTGEAPLPENAGIGILQKKLQARGIPVHVITAGSIITEGDSWCLEVLSPSEGASFEDLNDYSLILRLTYGSTAFLFTADAGYTAELEILNEDISCDVLKVGHHGSFGSTCTAFLEAADPNIAVISVGKDNEHGLPNDYVLERLEEKGITVLRTDESGTVRIESDGTSVQAVSRQQP